MQVIRTYCTVCHFAENELILFTNARFTAMKYCTIDEAAEYCTEQCSEENRLGA
jgi:hypothetical protein